MHKRYLIAAALLMTLFSILASGQTSAVAGPMLGYVPDGAGAVRAIVGMPGASLMGESREWGFDAAIAEISPGLDYALAVDGDGVVRRIDLSDTQAAARPVPGAMLSPGRVLVSPSGKRALLVSKAALAGQLITVGAEPVSLDFSCFPDKPVAIAVSDDGAVLASTENGLFLLLGGELRTLPSAGPITALAFTADGRDALAAGPGQLALISNVAGRPDWRVIATTADDFGTPIAVAAAARRAVLASSGAVMAVDLDGGAGARFDCPVARLARLNGDSFRLGDYSSGPVWMIDAGGREPRLLFIPPPAPAGEGVAQ